MMSWVQLAESYKIVHSISTMERMIFFDCLLALGSLCDEVLSFVFDHKLGRPIRVIIIAMIFPLISLMVDQVESLRRGSVCVSASRQLLRFQSYGSAANSLNSVSYQSQMV